MAMWQPGELLDDHPGTLNYSPPEVIRGRRYDGELRDVWSVGVVTYALLTRCLPFAEEKERDSRRKIYNGQLPGQLSAFSASAQNFLASCIDIVSWEL